MSGTRRANRADTARLALGRTQAQLSLSVQTGESAGEWPVDRSQLRRWINAALERDAILAIRLVGRQEGRALNLAWRGKDYATNVLTFAYGGEPLQADIVLCLPVLRSEARAQRKSLKSHLAHLVIHGVLHAQGYDHESDDEARRMETLETKLLARFRIADPYALVHTPRSAIS
ncbi:MAG: rRNA maturation RNase YbeY [Burkholderiaceae bacterium]